ncbi:MAG: hypothetical protein H6744_00275 [Deltaproteobacteria bacterium]|nr:hypothetical protein [Deltaproteobacteria bacterium]MCB9785100.1 hypothetical protein [Deltaproteobacteria bacterium]
MTRPRLAPFRIAWAVALLSSVASAAHAGNDDSVLIGDEAVLSGGAVTATVRTGAALWYNPAGLARVARDTVDVSGTAYALRLYRVPRLIELFGGEQADAKLNEVLVIPTAVTYVRPFRHARLALGIFVVDSENLTLRSQIESFQPAFGLTNEWLLAIESKSEQYRAVIGAAWDLSKRLSIGFSVQGIYQASSGTALFAGGFNDGTVDSRSPGFISFATLLSETGIGLAASLGVQWEPIDHLLIGASVITPSVAIYSSVTESSSLTQAPIVAGVGIFDTSDSKQSEARADLVFPARLRLGLAYEWSRVTVSVDGDIQHRLSNDRFNVDRGRVWNVRAGVQGNISSTVSLGAGFFTDRSPEKPVADLGDIDVDFYGFSLGVSYLKDRRLDPSTEKRDRLSFGSTFGLRYALGKGDFGGAQLSDTFADFSDLLRPRARAATIHEIALYVGTSFLF